MALIVKKFGGTSVGTLERIQAVADQLIDAKRAGEKLVVVVSAMRGETDRLLNLAYTLSPNPTPRELAVLITTGEQVSMALLAMVLDQRGVVAKSYNASQLEIQTDKVYDKARILKINTKKILADLNKDYLVIVAGFQGLSLEGEVTSLGRGGSDISAVALACALKADECQIFTDVDGIYTADPRVVPKAFRKDQIPFKAMLKLANLGSKVLQWRSVALAGKYHIPVRVLSSFKEGQGTLMNDQDESLESPQFVGLSHQLQLKRWVITVTSPKGDELAHIAENLSVHNINVEQMNQIHVDHMTKITVIIHGEDQIKATALIQALADQCHWKIKIENGLARIALVGMGLQSHAWVVAKFLEVLLKLHIYPEEVSYSELALSVILPETELTKAAQALHQVFFESAA